MNAITGYVMHQAERTIHSTRRLTVIVIALALIVASGLALLFEAAPATVTYGIANGVPVIVPLESEVCAGGTIHFPTITFIEAGTVSQINVAEAWCKAGLAGGCIGVIPDRPDLPLLEAKSIVNDRTPRPVPASLSPGVWHFWHSAVDERGNVAAYIVAPINVRNCETESPEP